jgi:hypothetical protein
MMCLAVIAETFIPDQGSLSDKILKILKKFLGFATPIFWGVGLTSGVCIDTLKKLGLKLTH